MGCTKVDETRIAPLVDGVQSKHITGRPFAKRSWSTKNLCADIAPLLCSLVSSAYALQELQANAGEFCQSLHQLPPAQFG